MDRDSQLDTIRLLNSIRDNKNLTTSEKTVAYTLALHRNSKTLLCCPTQETIAKEANCTPLTAARLIKSMEDKEFLVRIIKPWGTHRKYKYYFASELQPAFAISQNKGSALYRNGEKKDLLEAMDRHAMIKRKHLKDEFSG